MIQSMVRITFLRYNKKVYRRILACKHMLDAYFSLGQLCIRLAICTSVVET